MSEKDVKLQLLRYLYKYRRLATDFYGLHRQFKTTFYLGVIVSVFAVAMFLWAILTYNTLLALITSFAIIPSLVMAMISLNHADYCLAQMLYCLNQMIEIRNEIKQMRSETNEQSNSKMA